jgi:uncharacterized protein YciI
MQRRAVLALAATAVVGAPTPAAAAAAPTYFVLTHAPGPSWDHAKGFREQPGVEAHLGYMSGYADKGRIVTGGPFLDNSGGMMIFDVATLDDARAIAEADPTVKSGLLTVAVKPWLAVLARK